MMVQDLCQKLQLNSQAGIGRRLALALVNSDPIDPNIFHITSPKVGEAQALADVLSVQAKIVQLSQYQFRAQRIALCSWPRIGDADGKFNEEIGKDQAKRISPAKQ